MEKLVANIRNPRLREGEQREQLDLLAQLNRRHLEQRAGDAELEGQIRAMETAFHMQREAMETFDISREPQPVREAYGDTPFARSCLLARRLARRRGALRHGLLHELPTISRGTRMPITMQRHPKLCADGDRAAAALIADLKQRGMLDDTLVIVGRRVRPDAVCGEPGQEQRRGGIIITPLSPCCSPGGGVKRRAGLRRDR